MFFKNLFKDNKSNAYYKTDRLSKIEYFEKYQLKELFNLLHQAEELLEEVCSENSHTDFINFKKLFVEEIYELEGDNIADFTNIWNWFQTNKEWNQFTGLTGKELGHKILNITTNWKIDDDFISGFKVFLDNEYGVILDKERNNNFGIIRWDTLKEVDEEDWIGMFWNFKQMGGKVISQNHQFKYINDNGNLKDEFKSK
ncbi:hypothetical protein IX39_17335 [Chryseobacterium formosense]|uniref:Uncharacterized protein n=1 Tax=Chryseobacterium formosense TaxID=236814 RepID=A0A085Z141_9FLAO|nr:hypothetical protein [Chryseobacterium formosense]KFE98154.1 hypothetical protein IX39_17335 [Chryseobacterium formosense]SFT73688.1 hypothetical protein SAMN05421857_2869 [Chryseobacterium formosense]